MDHFDENPINITRHDKLHFFILLQIQDYIKG